MTSSLKESNVRYKHEIEDLQKNSYLRGQNYDKHINQVQHVPTLEKETLLGQSEIIPVTFIPVKKGVTNKAPPTFSITLGSRGWG